MPGRLELPLEQAAIPLLMSRPKIPWKWGAKLVELKPEEKLCVEIADKLRALTGQGKLRGVWFHVPNEGKRNKLTAIILKAMGMISGTWDFPLMGPWGNGVIEIKVGTNGLTDNQKYFSYWCGLWQVKRKVCYSWAEVEATLKEWGAI